MKKEYFRFIRINGKLVMSPRFSKKADADNWYHDMRRKKQLLRDGIALDDRDGTKFIDYARTWIKRRMSKYPAATWKSDEQRLRDYVLPFLSELPIQSITSSKIRQLLLDISEEGYLKPDFIISTSTRTRVQALLSAIFGDAFNEDPPLVPYNPALGIVIKDKRKGKRKPQTFNGTNEAQKFLSVAKKHGDFEFALCATFLMTGARKQELIALKRGNVFLDKKIIRIEEKYEQASGQILRGTKGGAEVSRDVPISDVLVNILKKYFRKFKITDSEAFVFSDRWGNHLMPRHIYNIVTNIAEEADLKASPHKLRHFFGQEFATVSGNVKALQAILGHSSSATTDIYSELAGERLKGFSDIVKIEIGAKRSK